MCTETPLLAMAFPMLDSCDADITFPVPIDTTLISPTEIIVNGTYVKSQRGWSYVAVRREDHASLEDRLLLLSI